MKNETLDPGSAVAKNEVLTEQEHPVYRQMIVQLNWAAQGQDQKYRWHDPNEYQAKTR